MAADNFDACINKVLEAEGGFVNNPKDPGGATNMGITLDTLSAWRKTTCTVDDVKNLTVDEAKQIYKANFWAPIHGDDLPAGVDMMVLDFAVNAGVGRAARVLEQVVEVPQDGIIGPKTVAAAKAMDPKRLIDEYAELRDAYYEALPTFSTFGKGWENRVVAVEQAALTMVG